MFGIFQRRSILIDIGLVFGAIVAMGVVAGVIVQRTNDQLISDARDAVWEASVPPAQVFSMINAQWLIHAKLGEALAGGGDRTKVLAQVHEAETGAAAVWTELTGLSPYFPADVKAEVDATSRLLDGFRASYRVSIAAVEANQSGEAVRAAAAAQTSAVQALASQVSHMLDVMRARIEHVNQRMEATSAAGLWRLGWVAVLMAGLIVCCGGVVLFRIVRPIVRLTGTMAALARDDLTVEVTASGRRDEIGSMAETVRIFKANAIETRNLRASQEMERESAAAERRAAMLQLALQFEATVGGIVQVVSQSAGNLEQSAEAMSGSADQAASRSMAVAADSLEATENVRTAAASTEHLSQLMTGVGEQTAAVETRIEAAAARARGTDEEVRQLGKAADSIGGVVGVIAAIANQTNLLALNATIEAARAGDYGRGFAIVASEVKQLATETARATTDITAQIQSMQSATTSTIQSIRAICEIIGDVAEMTRRIGTAIDGQVTATHAIATSVSKAASRTVTVTRNIAEVNEVVQGSEAIASTVLAAARDLSRTGGTLKTEMDGFLATVRAG